MLTALTIEGEQLTAWDSKKSWGPFFCPACFETLVLRKGYKVVHHFSHQPKTQCRYGAGESAEHQQCKYDVWKALRRAGVKAFLEVRIGSGIADILAEIKGCRIAIEAQKSVIPFEEVLTRTCNYTKNGVYSLWLRLSPDTGRWQRGCFYPYEQFLYRVYSGRLYQWQNDMSILPVHFGVTGNGIQRKDGNIVTVLDRFSGVCTEDMNLGYVLAEDAYVGMFGLSGRVPSLLLWQDTFQKWWKDGLGV